MTSSVATTGITGNTYKALFRDGKSRQDYQRFELSSRSLIAFQSLGMSHAVLCVCDEPNFANFTFLQNVLDQTEPRCGYICHR
jgi:hypothetical protein